MKSSIKDTQKLIDFYVGCDSLCPQTKEFMVNDLLWKVKQSDGR